MSFASGREPPALSEVFGEEPCIPLPRRLRKYLRILVSDPASMTFLALLEYAQRSVHSGEVEEGWVRIWPKKERIQREEGFGHDAINRHLRELEEVGAIRREQAGKANGNIFIRYLPLLADELETHPLVIAQMNARFELDLAKVHHITLPESASDPQVGEYGRTEEFQEWMEAQKEMTQSKHFGRQSDLLRTIAESKQRTAERREVQKKKPASQKLGKGKKNKDAIPVKDRGPYLTRLFREGVEAMGLVPEQDSNKLWAIMARLRTAHGGDAVRQMIEFFTSEAGWEEAKRAIWQLRDALVPRVGDLSRFDAEIRTLAEQRQKPKRSGGATTAPPPTQQTDDDELSF